MRKGTFILGFGLIIALSGCSNSDQNKQRQEEPEIEQEVISTASSSAAIVNAEDTTKKMIRTANLKFKVKDVIKSTYNIEDITSKHGGFVTFTELNSNIDNETTTTISIDSTLKTTYYIVTNSMIVRVPNVRLDTTLKEISRNIEFLDYRIIKAQDVALDILSNNLAQERLIKNEKRLTNAIDNRGRKLNETANAEDVLLSKQEQADNAKISNLSLEDQINFSTINLLIYQREAVNYELIPNDKNIEAYTPSFGSKIVESLQSGWNILEGIFVFLIKSWGVILFGFIAYFIYRKYRPKFKK